MSTRRKEANVISLAVITNALETAANEIESSENVKTPILVREAVSLSLSYSNLKRIENLFLVPNLRKLQLDNNQIEKIEGLEMLVNLEWLDLSFNSMKAITGLSTLKKLRDLTLFNNEIESVDGLESLTELQILSIGNNNIKKFSNILQLRNLPHLESLCVSGNVFDPTSVPPVVPPSSEAPSSSSNVPALLNAEGQLLYRSYVVTFFPKLKFLDYQQITRAERVQAREETVPADKLQEAEEKDHADERDAQIRKTNEESDEILVSSNTYRAVYLVDQLFQDEVELTKLYAVPNSDKFLKAFKSTSYEISKPLALTCIDQTRLTAQEIANFRAAAEQLLLGVRSWVEHTLRILDRQIKQLTAFDLAEDVKILVGSESQRNEDVAIYSGSLEDHHGRGVASVSVEEWLRMDRTQRATLKRELQEDVRLFQDMSMQRDVLAHEAIEDMLKLLDTNLSEIRAKKAAAFDTYFRGLEAAESSLTEALSLSTTASVSSSTHGPVPPTIDTRHEGEVEVNTDHSVVIAFNSMRLDRKSIEDESVSMQNDSESFINNLADMHTVRLNKILQCESETKRIEDTNLTSVIESNREQEMQRHRNFIAEISMLANDLLSKI